MTAAQRLRLVLALGVVNLVMAGVALGFGMVGLSTPPATAGGSTTGAATVSPAPTRTASGPSTPGATPSSIVPRPTGSPPTSGASGDPTSSPEASPTPSVEPTPASTAQTAANGPGRASVVAVVFPPKPTPAPPRDTSDDPGTPTPCSGSESDDDAHGPVARSGECPPGKGRGEHASKSPKARAKHDKHDKHDKRHRHDRHDHHPDAPRRQHGGGHHETAIDHPRPNPKSGRRLHAGRRAR